MDRSHVHVEPATEAQYNRPVARLLFIAGKIPIGACIGTRSIASCFGAAAAQQPRFVQYRALPGVRGNGMTSRTLASPVT